MSDAPDDPADQALLQILLPLSRLALAHGLRLPALVELLKLALVQAAVGAQAGLSMSQLSVRTGVHRKDLRRLLAHPVPRPTRSPASEVFARWLSDPRYLTARGKPRVLPRAATRPDEPSFDELVASVTTDVHSRGVLDELLRLAIVSVDARGRIAVTADAFVPGADRRQMLGLLADNVRDHLDAAVANLGAGPPGALAPFLEQAMFSDELSEASARSFNAATARAWEAVYQVLMPELQRLFEQDRATSDARPYRVRLGVYGYAERNPDAD
jgi:hypothetical protein